MNTGAVLLLPSILLTPSEARNSTVKHSDAVALFYISQQRFRILPAVRRRKSCLGGKKKKCFIRFGDPPTYGALGIVESVGVVSTSLVTSISALTCRRSDQRHHAELVQ